MTEIESKNIFAKNLNYYLKIKSKTQTDLVKDLSLSQSTVSDWLNAKKFPRIDKIEMLANYFGVEKSDLIEDKKEKPVFQKWDDETVEIMEELANRDEVKMLFKATRHASKEQIETVAKMIESLIKRSEED